MTVEEVRALSLTQKLQIMEILWDDLRHRFESAEVSQQVTDLLDDRRARAENGSSRIMDWDEVKSGFGKA